MTASLRLASSAFAIAIAAVALVGCVPQASAPTPTASPTGGTETDAFQIEVGDCLNDAALQGATNTVPIVECTEPHDSEAYSSVIVPDGDYPGQDAIFEQANAECLAAFDTYVGIAFEESSLRFNYFYPTAATWDAGDREVLCVVYDPKGPLSMSVRDSAL